ncbi:DUF6714 family protein [Methyloversatilis sp. XJ19-49]|uniref:DUF6714 family protein n=1 Tax=Methyloversatilis sp. XJ19-49 TaxID=2963429 RepID=UPI00211C9140|nr:hypothetical protein [Methyloversatilis sp. XJ19-49]
MSSQVIDQLQAAFPQRRVVDVITPHECDECAAIRSALAGRTWSEVPSSFAEEYCGSLPLLSPDAYNAYLPVWLRAAVENPDGDAAAMVPINLADEPIKEAFTPEQVDALIAVVEYVATHNVFGSDDPINLEKLAKVQSEWGRRAV